MATKKQEQPQIEAPTVAVSTDTLSSALLAAINAAKPPEKKTIFTRKSQTPWTPKDGSAKLKLKRKCYQHGQIVSEKKSSNEEIALWNKLRPGVFADGLIEVRRRRDKGIDLRYHVKTPDQRLRLLNQYGLRTLSEILDFCIKEAEKPRKSEFDVESDD